MTSRQVHSGGAWKKWEVDTLTRLYPTGGYRACQEALPGRSGYGIEKKAHTLGIRCTGRTQRPPRTQAHRDNPNTKPRADIKPEHVERRCLKCREYFLSEWAGNRVCRSCKSSSAWQNGGTPVGTWA